MIPKSRPLFLTPDKPNGITTVPARLAAGPIAMSVSEFGAAHLTLAATSSNTGLLAEIDLDGLLIQNTPFMLDALTGPSTTFHQNFVELPGREPIWLNPMSVVSIKYKNLTGANIASQLTLIGTQHADIQQVRWPRNKHPMFYSPDQGPFDVATSTTETTEINISPNHHVNIYSITVPVYASALKIQITDTTTNQTLTLAPDLASYRIFAPSFTAAGTATNSSLKFQFKEPWYVTAGTKLQVEVENTSAGIAMSNFVVTLGCVALTNTKRASQ